MLVLEEGFSPWYIQGGNPLSDPNNSDDQLGVNEHEPKELGKDLGHHSSPSNSLTVWSPSATRYSSVASAARAGRSPQLRVLERAAARDKSPSA